MDEHGDKKWMGSRSFISESPILIQAGYPKMSKLKILMDIFLGLSVRFVLLLDPNSPASMPGRWLCGSFARLLKAAAYMPVLCAHARREAGLPTQLGLVWAVLKGIFKNPGRVSLIEPINDKAT